MPVTDWPRPPIQPGDLPRIRELLTAEEYAALTSRRPGLLIVVMSFELVKASRWVARYC